MKRMHFFARKKKMSKANLLFIIVLGSLLAQAQQLQLIPKQQNGKWGYISNTGSWVIAPAYDYAQPFEGELAIAGTGKWMIKTSKYDQDIKSPYFQGTMGLIDKTGKWVLPCEWIKIYNLKDGMRLLAKGEYIIDDDEPDAYRYMDITSYAFANEQGKIIVPPGKYNLASEFKNGYAMVGKGDFQAGVVQGLEGVINKKGIQVVGLKYQHVFAFNHGLARVAKGEFTPIFEGKYGYINTAGKEIIPARYEDASDFSDGMAAVKLNGLYGYIDTTGKMVIKNRFAKASRFFDGLAVVGVYNKKMGKAQQEEDDEEDYLYQKPDTQYVISKAGKILYTNANPSLYISDFSGGVSIITVLDDNENAKTGLMSKQFKIIKEPDDFSIASDGWIGEHLIIVKNKKYGLLKKDGTLPIVPKYQYLAAAAGGLLLAIEQDQLFYIDTEGKEWRD
jgi:hypothetical protein